MTRSRALAALLLAPLLLASCEENRILIPSEPEFGARIKFFNFGINAPGVNFYADATKMTAISSTTQVESTNGVAYAAAGSGGFYGSIAPGAYSVTGRIAAATDKNLIIATQATTLAAGSSYSFYMSGFYNTGAKTSDSFIVQDDFPADIDFSVAFVRFVHASPNAAPMTLYARHTVTLVESAVGAEISYKGAEAFVALPSGSYDLGTRYAGVGTNAISRTAVSFVAGRTYTIAAFGDITIVSTTATNRPRLDQTANR